MAKSSTPHSSASSSVCPGYLCPARHRAALCNGAVVDRVDRASQRQSRGGAAAHRRPPGRRERRSVPGRSPARRRCPPSGRESRTARARRSRDRRSARSAPARSTDARRAHRISGWPTTSGRQNSWTAPLDQAPTIDFRTDASRIAKRDRDTRFGHASILTPSLRLDEVPRSCV